MNSSMRPKKTDPEAYRPVNILPGPGIVRDSSIAEQQNNSTEEVNLIPREHHKIRSLHGIVTASIVIQI